MSRLNLQLVLIVSAFVSLFGLTACVERNPHDHGKTAPSKPSQPAVCVDQDKDGFGDGCDNGHDCDDGDKSIHQGCLRCVTPTEGCACDPGAKAVSCFLDPTLSDAGAIMCHEGTRYCRTGLWSACESIIDYPKPTQSTAQAVIQTSATPQNCNDCNVDCFVVRDNLDPVDGGLTDANSGSVSFADGGGLALTATAVDGGTPADAGSFDPSKCVLHTAPDSDCDGIPDKYDPYPDDKPFETANPTLFLDIAPGETGTGIVDLAFYLNSADVYFFVDQTGSMEGERAQLTADLRTGDFIQNAAYQCSDYDFDFKANNELKTQGIIGAIRCIIRDANFGVGFFRELPFYSAYGYDDQVVFRNYSDITSDLTKVTNAVGLLTTDGNIDWPEADLPVLNTLITGNGMYFGTNRPGIPARVGCPANTWGYGCFRNGAIPIVVLFTDAPMHNGPTNNTHAYSAASLGITKGTTSTITSVPATNESWASAYDLGDVTNSFTTYAGDTTNMTSDITRLSATCVSSSSTTGKDALFKFSLTQAKTVNLTTEGSDFDTTVSLMSGAPAVAAAGPAISTPNDVAGSAYSFGGMNSKYVSVSGTTTGYNADYSVNDIGCSAAGSGKDTTFTFSLTTPTKIALDTSGSTIGTVVSLFGATPPPSPTNIAVPNTNDTLTTTYNAGDVYNQIKGFTGDTSQSGITANYTNVQMGSCGAADTSPDATYSFTLSQPTKVRLRTEASTIPTVIALTNSAPQFLTASAIANTNDLEASAYDMGTLDNRSLQLTGSTSSLAANYTAALVGCASVDTSRDGVFKFTLGSTKTIQMDTDTSAFDTTLSLFNTTIASPDTAVTIASQTNETGLTANSLGTVNNKRYIVSGGTTAAMIADYNGTQISCGSTTAAPDSVFKFHLDTATRVRIDTVGSAFDTVLSLHSPTLPDPAVTTMTNTNEAQASAYVIATNIDNHNFRFDGSTASMTADVGIDDGAGCAAVSTAKDAVFKFTVATAGSYEINTNGSGFDTVLGLFPSTISVPAVTGPTAEAGAGDTKNTAINLGPIDGSWLSFSGTTTSAAMDSTFTCGSGTIAATRDVYYKFTLAAAHSFTIDTIGSAFDTVIGLFNTSDDSQVTCDNDSGNATAKTSLITRTLNPGAYYVVVKGKTASTRGNYTLTFKDNGLASNILQCDNDSGLASGASRITRNLTPGTYYAVVKGLAAANSGAYKLTVQHADWVNAANRLTCNDNASGTTSQIEQDLAAGDYWVVVKGKAATDKGVYKLTVQDVTTPPLVRYVDCNDDHGAVNTSLLNETLAAGTYFIVLKGYAAGNQGTYKLTIKDTAAVDAATIQCDYNSGPSGSSLIERDLAAGTYKVIVKGKAAADKGAYKLVMRDVTHVTSSSLGCDHNSGTGGKSYLETSLAAGTYNVVVKGDAATTGAYNLSIRDSTALNNADQPISCNNDYASGYTTSRLSAALNPGTYYAAVKGYKSTNFGNYQLSIGAAATTTGTSYTPPTYSQTLAALQAKKVRVMSVLSCHDDPAHGDVQGDCVDTRNQATALANATSAFGAAAQPLVFDIDGDGKGLSTSVVQGVAALAKYLQMNVQIRVVFDPDANPGFGLKVTAVDRPGDGCDGLIGIEHQNCVPGATPRFQLEFTNPISKPVPANPKDPKGGYNFRAELVGNNQFIVDQVPIYIIPTNVTHLPPEPKVAASGTYQQDIPAKGCTGNKTPDWRDLSWDADLPSGTTITFNACTVADEKDFAKCTYTKLCTITGGDACMTDHDCPTGGVCSASGTCQMISSGTCANDSQCPFGAVCVANKCMFDGQPVYVGATLGPSNYKPLLRMKIDLTANTTTNRGPLVHDWSLTYVCENKL